MDLQVILSSIKTLNDYIGATRNLRNFQNLEIQLNVSTVLSLKKVRSLEIEYFSKCDEHGVAFAILDRLLKEPPSKKWILPGKALTPTILYWLDAVRKHLISHSQNWWTILQTLLRFIKELKSKDPSLPDVMVQQTMECLLDLACNQRLNEPQRHEILNTVNECSAESTRELRNEMKDQLSGYFIKLSKILPNCGHFPTQLSILESLLRWLLGRYNPQVPDPLYQRFLEFLERNRPDFYQNAREFLILLNGNRSDLITSALCEKFMFGSFSLIQELWNYAAHVSSEAMEVLESPEERSIETGGKSPITGHNDFDEPPPSDEIDKYVSPVKTQKTASTKSIASVVLKRLSSDEINKWLPMPSKGRDDVSKGNANRYNTRSTTKNPKRINKKTPQKKPTVQFKKNMASSQTSSSKDKSNHAMKDLLEKVMESLEITITEMNQSTDKKLALWFMDNQEKLRNLQKELLAMEERLSAEVISELKRFEEFLERWALMFMDNQEELSNLEKELLAMEERLSAEVISEVNRFQEKIAEIEKELKLGTDSAFLCYA